MAPPSIKIRTCSRTVVPVPAVGYAYVFIDSANNQITQRLDSGEFIQLGLQPSLPNSTFSANADGDALIERTNWLNDGSEASVNHSETFTTVGVNLDNDEFQQVNITAGKAGMILSVDRLPSLARLTDIPAGTVVLPALPGAGLSRVDVLVYDTDAEDFDVVSGATFANGADPVYPALDATAIILGVYEQPDFATTNGDITERAPFYTSGVIGGGTASYKAQGIRVSDSLWAMAFSAYFPATGLYLHLNEVRSEGLLHFDGYMGGVFMAADYTMDEADTLNGTMAEAFAALSEGLRIAKANVLLPVSEPRSVSGALTLTEADLRANGSVFLLDSSVDPAEIDLLEIPGASIIILADDISENNLTVNAPAGKTINGESSVVFNTAHCRIDLVCLSNGNYQAYLAHRGAPNAAVMKVYKHTVNADTFSAAPGGSSTFETGTAFSIPAGEQLVSARIYQNQPFIITGGSTAQLIVNFGSANTIFQIEAYQGAGLDAEAAGFKGQDRDRTEMGLGSSMFSKTAPTDFYFGLDLGAATFADITQYAEVDIWILTQKLPA